MFPVMSSRFPLRWLLLVLLLAACKSEEPLPMPTRVDVAALATQDAQQNPSPSLTLTPLPSSPTPSRVPATATPSPSPSLTPSPTVDSAAQQYATDIMLTNTALAGVLPFTQTAAAFWEPTQTAAALLSPTPWPSPTLRPEANLQFVFYSDRHGNDDIFLRQHDGTVRALTGSLANEREPSCSPDGRFLVYASDETGSYQLYLLPLDGIFPIPLTDSAGINFAPIFSPNGGQIAFVSTRNNGIPTIWVMNADGSDPRQVTTVLGRNTAPSWGPGGRQLLFSSDQFGTWDLFLTVLDEEVEGEFPLMPPEFNQGNQLWPVFDADGERVAYTQWNDLTDPQTADLYLLDFEQPEPSAIRTSDGADIAWAWSDDTHLLASVGGPDDVQIALVDVTTGAVTHLTESGTFNGGARICSVPAELLPPEPKPMPSLTPAPTITPSPEPTPLALSPAILAAFAHPYAIRSGDTLMQLSQRYDVSWHDIAAINRLPNPNRLSIGQRLFIPVTHGTVPTNLAAVIDAGASDLGSLKEIVVDLDQQQVRAYEDKRLVRTVIVSTGLPDTPTITGEFSIYIKREKQTMRGPDYYLPNVPYVMYFFQGYGLHGTYWHDNFGEPMSHGCVNLPTDEAQWFYEWAEIGTKVRVLPESAIRDESQASVLQHTD